MATSSSASSSFQTQNGQIIDPNGNVFTARGINIGQGDMSNASQMLTDFPGLNFVRLAIASNADPSQLPSAASLASFIQTMTAHGVVVEIEDHPWGSGSNPQPNPYTGSELATETAWYASVASYYKDNPYVWFGTMNEPESGDGGIMQAQVNATYDAIRGAGNNSPIMIEAGVGSGNAGTVGDGGGYSGPGSGYTASDFTQMSNIVWDFHFYGGGGTFATDPTAITAALEGSAAAHSGVAAMNTITSADGKIPIIIGETGDSVEDSTTGGAQTIQVAYTSSLVNGAVAWAWYPQQGSGDAQLAQYDDLTDGNGNLSSYGQMVAAYIAQGASSTPTSPPTGTGTTTPPTSPGTTTTSSQELTPTTGGSLKDTGGNVWTLTSGGVVEENGTAVPGGSGTEAFAIVNSLYYGQDATSGQWYTYSTNTQSWTSASAPTLTPPTSTGTTPPPTNTGTTTTSPQELTPTTGGSLTDTGGNVWTLTSGGVVEENGTAVPGGSDTEAFAIVNSLYYGQDAASGQWFTYSTTTQSWTSASAPTLSPPTSTGTTTPPASTDTLTLRISEDAWNGNAQFSVSVDGKQVGGTLTASALHATGDGNVFVLTGNWGQAKHDVQINFINDAYGGAPTKDRNLYVNSIAYDGVTYSKTTETMLRDGAKDFSVAGNVAAGTAPADTVTLHLSEDAWHGNASFELMIDGKQISTPQAVVTLHSSGQWENLTFAGNLGAGTHQIGVEFTNAASGGTTATQRTLYVDGIDANGQHYGNGVSTLSANGSALFTVVTTH